MKKIGFLFFVALLLMTQFNHEALGREMDRVKQQTSKSIRSLIEPLLDTYCHSQCKLLSVESSVDLHIPDEVSPGFDDVLMSEGPRLATSHANVRILMDEMLGPVTRKNILDLIQQHTDAFDFHVQLDTRIAKFPQPADHGRKVADLREEVTRNFRDNLERLFDRFCPNQCMLTDLEVTAEPVNLEEAQYGRPGEFIHRGDVALRISRVGANILMDDSLTLQERTNILEAARLQGNYLNNVEIVGRSFQFPRPSHELLAQNTSGSRGPSSITEDNRQSTIHNQTEATSNQSLSSTTKTQEIFERIERIERVEDGDAIQAELEKFKTFGLIFACSIIALLLFLAAAGLRGSRAPRGPGEPTVHRIVQTLTSDPTSISAPQKPSGGGDSSYTDSDRRTLVARRYEIERYYEELLSIFSEHPKVAKQVFSRVLTEEGIETTAEYLDIFGEGIVLDLLKDPSLQADMAELTEYYAKNIFELNEGEKLDLLKALHNRTVSAKMVIMGNRSTALFDFLAEMDSLQTIELVRNESLTVKAIILTQCDAQKRTSIYSKLDEETRLSLLTELSRIDHLPRDYIYNVASALKRKRQENPRLNTEALPGSDVLVTLLERTDHIVQQTVIKNLELSNPESARSVMNKLVSLDTLHYLKDNQLLEVVLSLKHDELLQFLKGGPPEIKATIFAKAPKDLVEELEEELVHIPGFTRESYLSSERKILHRIKTLAQDGQINLIETNERMFRDRQEEQAGRAQAGRDYLSSVPTEGIVTGNKSRGAA
jgi:flagellar motor switch protein FliG